MELMADQALASGSPGNNPRVPDMYIQPGVPESIGNHDGRVTGPDGLGSANPWAATATRRAAADVSFTSVGSC